MSKVLALVALAAAGIAPKCSYAQVVSETRGYALMFQGSNPMAAVKKGLIDFADTGMDQVDAEATLACWMTQEDFNSADLRLPVSWTNDVDSNFFQPFAQTRSFFFGNLKNLAAQNADPRIWHHYAASYSGSAGTFVVYIDGEVVGDFAVTGGVSMRGPDGTTAPGTSFYVGANTYQRIDKPAVALPSKAHFGKLDDLTLFSRALSQTEIQTLMDNPIQRDSVPADAVLHYDFDVTCPGTPGTSPGLLDPACTLAGDKLVPNLGAAGSDYDLLLGEMNNDYGFGKTWSNPTDTEGCPAEHPFAVPDLVPSDSPAGSTAQGLDVPTVAFVGENGQVDLSLPEGHSGKTFTVASVPSSGTLADGAGTPLTVGDTVAGSETVRYSAPAVMDEPVWFHFTVTGGGTHQAHIWPLATPGLDPIAAAGGSIEVNLLEDATVVIRTRLAATAYGGEGLDTVVRTLPTVGLLEDMNEVDGTDVVLDQVTLAVNSVATHPVGAVRYSPPPDSYGKNLASFQVVFRSRATGLESPPLTVKISVEGVNDKPIAEDSNATIIIEDDAAGVEIPVKGSDSESRHGMVISRLPRHGTLYTGREANASDGSIIFDTPVEREYQIFDVGEVIEQHAYEVVGVSSFWGGPPYLGYHPMNVLGRQTCWAEGNGECDDNRFDSGDYEFLEGDLVRIPEDFGDGTSNADRHGIIERVYAGEDGSIQYDVRVLAMQRVKDNSVDYDSWELEPCVMVGPTYPEDCSVAEAAKHDGGRPLLRGVSQSDFATLNAGAWSPLLKDKGGNPISGGEKALAYGSQYAYNNYVPADMYDTSSPPYTEFIEVKFKETVFIAGIEIGSPRGAGAVVAIRVKDPQSKEWVPIYESPVLIEAQTEFNQRGLYHQFAPDVCRPFFSTDTVRVELDTSGETGIGDWNYMDYIKLFGAREAQPALLTHDAVLYVPDPDFFGTDSFEFSSYDCGGARLRVSEPGIATIDVTPVDDKPTVAVFVGDEAVIDGELQYDLQADQLDLHLSAVEVDGDAVEIRASLTPSSRGTLMAGAVGNGFAAGKAFDVTFKPAPCVSTLKMFDMLVVEVRDAGSSDVTKTEVNIEIDCGSLERQLVFAEPDSGSTSLAAALGVVGSLVAAMCMVFNIVFRTRQVVRMTSPNINVVIIVGALFVFCYLITFLVTVQDAPGCDRFLADLQAEADLGAFTLRCDLNATQSCCRSSATVPCTVQPWLLSMGVVMTFGSLFSKTVRISKLFLAKLNKIKRISDNQLMRRVGVILAILVVYLLFWEILSPKHVEFSVGQEVVLTREDDSQYISTPLLATCSSEMQSVFVAGLVMYVGGLLVYGAFLAYSVRNIHVKQANDSKQIAISVYNIMLFGGLNMVITNVIPDPSALLALLSVITFLCATSTLLILFVPRMHDVYTGKTVSLSSGKSSNAGGAGTTGTNMLPTNVITTTSRSSVSSVGAK